MQPIDKTYIMKQFEGMEEIITSVVNDAWKDWLEAKHASWSPRGRANFVWEQISVYAKKKLMHLPNIRTIEKNQTLQFLVNDTILFRFKKGDVNGLSANYPTQLALSYHDHDEELIGLPEIFRVDVSYILSKPLENEINDVVVVARDKESILWATSLMNKVENVVPLPSNDNAQDEPVPSKVVRVKTQLDDEKKNKRK